MPYRYFLVPVAALMLLYFGYIYKTGNDPNLWVLLNFSIALVVIFIFKHQINEWYWNLNPIELDKQEKSWILDHINYINRLNETERKEFFLELAKYCEVQEFITMGDFPVPEEAKWICLSPAIRLKIYKNQELYRHYLRTVFYKHPFLTPDEDYIHISETNKEDGVLIFSLEQLMASTLIPNKYFNPALYEWCKIWSEINISNTTEHEQSLAIEIVCDKLSITEESITHWMGKKLNMHAICIYCYIEYPEELNTANEEFFNFIKSNLDGKIISEKSLS